MNDSMNIQPSGDSGQSMPPLNNAQDLINAFYGLSNAGDQVELFFSVAGWRPGEAFRWFVTILQNRAEPPLRGLALQGLGHITDEPTRLDITSGQSDYSIALLHLLAEEIRGSKAQSNDLTRWSAAWAIEALRFSRDLLAHVEGGALAEPPERIRREIIDRKLDEMERLERLNSRGSLAVDYERYLEFWLYAAQATVEFLNDQGTNRRFLEVARDIIDFWFVQGIEFGASSTNSSVQEIALESAKQRFTTNEGVEQRLYQTLKRFLLEDYRGNVGFQRMAAEAVVQAGNWLNRGELTKAAILCERWERIVQIGEPAVPILEKIVWKVLQFSTKPKIDLERAVQTIGKINFSSRDQKLRVLSKILLHQHKQIRETVAKILKDHRIKSDEFPLPVSNIIEVITYTYTWNLDESNLNDSALSELSQILQNLDGTKNLLRNLENQAISEVKGLSNIEFKGLSNEFKLTRVSAEKYLSQKVNDNLKTVNILFNKIELKIMSIKSLHEDLNENKQSLQSFISKLHQEGSVLNSLPSKNVIALSVVNEGDTWSNLKTIQTEVDLSKNKLVSEVRESLIALQRELDVANQNKANLSKKATDFIGYAGGALVVAISAPIIIALIVVALVIGGFIGMFSG